MYFCFYQFFRKPAKSHVSPLAGRTISLEDGGLFEQFVRSQNSVVFEQQFFLVAVHLNQNQSALTILL
jgi:hypothetical protein